MKKSLIERLEAAIAPGDDERFIAGIRTAIVVVGQFASDPEVVAEVAKKSHAATVETYSGYYDGNQAEVHTNIAQAALSILTEDTHGKE